MNLLVFLKKNLNFYLLFQLGITFLLKKFIIEEKNNC